jgi:hypothetical protein
LARVAREARVLPKEMQVLLIQSPLVEADKGLAQVQADQVALAFQVIVTILVSVL